MHLHHKFLSSTPARIGMGLRHVLLLFLAFTGFLGFIPQAHAARTITSVTLNNASSVTVTPGDFVTLVVNVTTDGTGNANDWNSTGWRISATPPGAMTCWDHGNHTSAGSYSENTTIQVPTTPGTYNAYFVAYNDNSCSSGASATTVLASAVVVVAPLVINSATLDGASSVSVAAGQTITAVVNATSNSSLAGYQWRSTGWRISTSAPGAVACVNHPNHETAGTFNETFSITAPSSAGTYNAYFIAYNDDSCGAGASPTASMASAVTIPSLTEFNSTGGSTATNGLHFYMEDTTKVQVRRLNNTGQVYAPGSIPPSNNLDNGVFIRANGLVYGPSHTVGGGYVPSGGMYNTYSITPATPANPSSSGVQQTATGAFGITAGPQVSVLWKYTTPLDFLTAEVTLTIPSGYAVSATNPVRYYHVFDTYLGGSDNGCGVSFVDTNGKRVIGTYPPASGTTCPSSTSIPAGVSVVESFRERSGQVFSKYCASGWASFFDTSTPNCSVRQAAVMSNTVVTSYQDTGIGVELDFTAPGTYTFSYDFVIGSPVVPPYDHLEIRHDGAGTLCSETVTVLACTSSEVPCLSANIVNTGTLTGSLTTSPASPAITKTPASFSIGSSSSTQNIGLQADGAGAVTLGTSGLSTTPLNGTKCWNTATSSQSCSLTFTNTPCVSGFECLETGLTHNNLTAPSTARNPLYTKLSGTDFKFDVVALQSSGAQATAYSAAANVTVELFDNSASPAPACSAYAGPLASQAITFAAADSGRKTLSANFNLANAYGKVRCRVRDSNQTPVVYGCSSDDFAVRPQQFTVTSASANADATGASTTASPKVMAGSAFELTAGTATVGYGGTPVLDATQAAAHTGATQVGALAGTFGAATPATGNGATGASFSYGEVGYFRLNAGGVVDSTFAAVDSVAGDCVVGSRSNTAVGGKFGCSIGSAVSPYFGRFIPHHFDTVVTQGCNAANFTYSAQPFTVVATARNQANGTTANYTGAGWAKATTLSNAGVLTNLTGNLLAAADFAAGVGTANNVRYTFPVPTTLPAALVLRAVDTEAVSSNGFAEGGANIRSGRARLLNAYGSELLDLPMTFRTEFWESAANGWRTNVLDSCTTATLVFTAVTAPSITGNTCATEAANASGVGCAAAPAVANRAYLEGGLVGTDSNGVAGFAGNFNLWLRAPGAGHPGSINVTAAVPVWLQYNWTGAVANPVGRATFGVFRSPLIYRRENY